MAVINIPASKSLTLSNKIPTGNIKDRKIVVGRDNNYIYYSYLFFDISSIPSDILLVSATLVLFKVADFFNAPTQKFYIYPLLKQFSSFTTYDNDCPIDLDPTVRQVFLPFTQEAAVEVNITALVNKWISDTLVNRGIALQGSYSKNCPLYHTSFGSAYSKDNTLIPFIRVNFKQDPCLCFLPKPITYTAKVIPSSRG